MAGEVLKTAYDMSACIPPNRGTKLVIPLILNKNGEHVIA